MIFASCITRVAAFILAAVLFGACYEPIANTSDQTPGQPSDSYSDPDVGETPTPDMNNDSSTNGSDSGSGETAQLPVAGGFRSNVEANLKSHGLNLSSVVDESDPVERRIFAEYGAVFLTTATPPSKVLFPSDADVTSFQSKAGSRTEVIGGAKVELQQAALAALDKAIAEARSKGLSITPRGGEEASKRSFGKTLDLWNSRFLKACDHWVSKGRLTSDQAAKLKALPIGRQVAEVLELEKKGIYFSTYFNTSILSSVAAPGTSQHLSMLAFDATEFNVPEVRKIMAENGWFRTVQNDQPHFTYLGRRESDLSAMGLKRVVKDGGEYWVPDI